MARPHLLLSYDFPPIGGGISRWMGELALRYPECTKHLGPIVAGATLANGARVPGTGWQLEPVHAAFNIGAMIRWLDFNDTWLAAEWGHPAGRRTAERTPTADPRAGAAEELTGSSLRADGTHGRRPWVRRFRDR